MFVWFEFGASLIVVRLLLFPRTLNTEQPKLIKTGGSSGLLASRFRV